MTDFYSTALKNNPFQNKGEKKLLDATDVLDAVTSSYFITNENLQIVYYNEAFIKSLGLNAPKEVKGLRPGDVLGCINTHLSDGCGTSPKCQSCSFRKCIEDALSSGKKINNEVTLTHINNKMVAYHIQATPFTLEDSKFVSISSIEITARKRKQLLESVFFHDLINLAGSMSGYLDVIGNFDPEEVMTHLPALKGIADQLLDEIVSQRQVARAEDNRLEADINRLNIQSCIREIQNHTTFHPSFKNRNLNIEFDNNDFSFYSDNRLLSRVLINMLRNAMESTAKGNTVSLSIKKENDEIIFAVHNKEYMLPEVQENIFTYGFSTKGAGRGLGTYGMRLLGENLLCGKVSFLSSPGIGTTFYLIIPIIHPNTPLNTPGL